MNKPIKKNFVELNKNLAKLCIKKSMPTASDRKLVAKKSIKKQLENSKKKSTNQKKSNSTDKLNKMAANVSFVDDLDINHLQNSEMAMTSAGYALYIAIKRQQFRDIVRLLQAGVHFRINKNGLRGGGPLHHLIKAKLIGDDEMIKKFRLKTAKVMIEYGVDANLKDFYGKTALMLACTEGYLELVKLLSPITDPLIQDCRLNTALIYTVLAQRISCCIEILKNTPFPLVKKLIKIRNCNGVNAMDIAKQLGNREIILHLTHYLAFAEQNLLKQQFKKSKLDPRYADNYWLLRNKPSWKADWLDWQHPSQYLNHPLYWNTSRSMESLSTKDGFDDDKILPKESRKLLIDPTISLATTVKSREKAISNREEIDKVLAGHNLSRLDSLNLRRKLEEERLNRAMSMYNLPSKKLFLYDDPIHDPIIRHHWKDDDSVTSSMIFDYDLQSNLKQQMRKQRMYEEALNSRKPNDRYFDQLMLNDNMFYGDLYEEKWKDETVSWFKNNGKNDNKMSKSSSSHTIHNPNNEIIPTPPRRMSKAENKQQEIIDEQMANDQKSNKQQISTPNQNFKLPPVANQRNQSYEEWVQQQELKK